MSRIALLLGLMMSVVVGQVYAQPASLSAYRAAVQADNPSGFWYLDETSGTTAADASSVGGTNNGTYYGPHGTLSGFIAGSVAYDSTGADDYVRILDTFDNGAMASGAFTVEHWLNPDHPASGAANSAVRGFFGIAGHPAQFIQQNGGNISAGVAAGGGGTVVSGITHDRWTHVVWTAAPGGGGGTDLKLYFDGVEVGSHNTGSVAADNSGQDLAIGTLPFGPPTDPYSNLIQGFDGGIDEVSYFDYALSAEQVLNHYNAPEPTSLFLLMVSILGLMGIRYRR